MTDKIYMQPAGESYAASDFGQTETEHNQATIKTIKRQTKPTMKPILICATIVGMITATANAQNADITWGTPTAISGTSDVSIVGTLVGTWAPGDDWGGGNRADFFPVNGVTFAAYGSGPFGSFISQTGFDDRYGSFANPGTSDANYNYLLQTAEYNNYGDGGSSSSILSMTWGGMTAGDTYQLEFWVQDGRNGGSVDRSETLTGGANTSDALTYGFAGGGAGHWILGTFVADGTGTETLTVTGAGGGPNNPSAQVNLLQLRDITPAPEPSTLAVLAGGFGMMMLGFRRKNRAV